MSIPLKVPEKGWFTPKELGQAIGRHYKTLYRHMDAGLLDFNQPVAGGEIRIYPADAQRYLQPKTAKP